MIITYLAMIMTAINLALAVRQVIHYRNIRKLKKTPAFRLLEESSETGVALVESRDDLEDWEDSEVTVVTFNDGVVFRFSPYDEGFPDIGDGKVFLDFPDHLHDEVYRKAEEFVCQYITAGTTRKLLTS